ncbi:MAG: RNA polymerase sigma-70 factor [Mangrovibacterium sp.]
MTQPDDRNLLFFFGDEPVKSFEKLFRTYYQRLFLYVRKFVDEHTANDILQDLFYSVWQDRHKNRVIQSPEHYLFAMARHRCFQHLKKRNASGIPDLQTEEYHFFDTGESVLQFDIDDTISGLFATLPPRSREVFLLSRKKGLSNKEIAGELNISIKAVEKHITISIKHFKQTLQIHYPELFTFFSVFLQASR